MTLENLLKIGQLKIHTTDAQEISRLLEAAQRNLMDARVEEISTETRFDAAYKSIMQAALAALMANGFRPDTNKPGHHMTVVQSLPLTIGIQKERVIVLDTLRRKLKGLVRRREAESELYVNILKYKTTQIIDNILNDQ